jgi:uncharacterized protein YdeI (YjbR/CyaY-like superfamily)
VPSVVVDPKSVRAFANEAAFEAWLKQHHLRAAELWIKIYKKASGKPSIDWSQAVDVALCWGWIDGIRKQLDAEAFVQRFTPRQAKSRWSQINRERVAKLVEAKRMTPHGQKHVDAAKADGRWDDAYASSKSSQVPEDFLAALAKKPRALRTYQALTKAYTFSISYRLSHLKTAERRASLMQEMIQRLDAGELPFAKPLRPTDKKPKLDAPPKKLASKAVLKASSSRAQASAKAPPRRRVKA